MLQKGILNIWKIASYKGNFGALKMYGLFDVDNLRVYNLTIQ